MAATRTAGFLAGAVLALAGCGDKGIQTDNCGISCGDSTQCHSSELSCRGGTCKSLECGNCSASQTCRWSTSNEGNKTYCKFDKCE